jgi:hypothetical protein
MKQATIRTAISDTTPGIITALLANPGSDDEPATTPASSTPPAPTSTGGFGVSSHHPIRRF